MFRLFGHFMVTTRGPPLFRLFGHFMVTLLVKWPPKLPRNKIKLVGKTCQGGLEFFIHPQTSL
jgi:hypothetical protein